MRDAHLGRPLLEFYVVTVLKSGGHELKSRRRSIGFILTVLAGWTGLQGPRINPPVLTITTQRQISNLIYQTGIISA